VPSFAAATRTAHTPKGDSRQPQFLVAGEHHLYWSSPAFFGFALKIPSMSQTCAKPPPCFPEPRGYLLAGILSSSTIRRNAETNCVEA
jgi:hypothetical protein